MSNVLGFNKKLFAARSNSLSVSICAKKLNGINHAKLFSVSIGLGFQQEIVAAKSNSLECSICAKKKKSLGTASSSSSQGLGKTTSYCKGPHCEKEGRDNPAVCSIARPSASLRPCQASSHTRCTKDSTKNKSVGIGMLLLLF